MASIKKFFLLHALTDPLTAVSDHLTRFFRLGGLFALILLLISYAFGQHYGCRFGATTLCSDIGYGRVVYMLCQLVAVGAFFSLWNAMAYEDETLKAALKKTPYRQYAFNGLILFLFLILNFLPVISVYALIRRVPNHNWIIELSYFLLVSTGFWVPIILMRFYAALPDLLTGTTPSWRQIFRQSSEAGVKLVFATALIFMLICFFMIGVARSLSSPLLSDSFAYDLFAEAAFDFSFLLASAVFFAYCKSLYNLFNVSDQGEAK